MLRVALTGGIASGKSTVAAYFAKLGVPVIDCDLIARELCEPNASAYQNIVDHFGTSVLGSDGRLNRHALRELIFSEPKERLWLEQLLHPLIRAEIRQRLTQLKAPYCLIVIPLLSESKGIDFIDRVCVVDTPLSLQLARIQARDHCSPEEAERMVKTQHSSEQRLKLADDVIHNEGDLDSLQEQVQNLHKAWLTWPPFSKGASTNTKFPV